METIVQPSPTFVSLDLKELWSYRELLLLLAWRDVTVRYNHTVLGIVWVIVQPVAMTFLFTVIFGLLGKLPAGGTSYPLLSLAGLLPWQYFARSITDGYSSLLGSRGLITKVYFPRVVIPLAACLPALLDLAVSLPVLAILLIVYKTPITVNILALPALVLMLMGCALGPVLWFSALCAYYKDVRHLVPFVIQLLMFASPVAYSLKLVPHDWRWLYSLNPMVGVIEGFRWSLLPGTAFPGLEIVSSLAVSAVLLYSGLWFFCQVERGMADVI